MVMLAARTIYSLEIYEFVFSLVEEDHEKPLVDPSMGVHRIKLEVTDKNKFNFYRVGPNSQTSMSEDQWVSMKEMMKSSIELNKQTK